VGWRFSKRVKVLPGVSLNLSKSGVSTSIGGPGAKITIGHGKVRETVGIPGTGVSYTNVHHADEPNASAHQQLPGALAAAEQESGWVTFGRILWKIVYWVTIGIFALAIGLVVAALAAGSSSSGHRRRRF